jgi:hypothetical protein
MRIAAFLKLPLMGVDTSRVGGTDSDSFASARIPVVTIHSITQETLRTLHGSGDRLDAIRGPDYYDSYRLVAVYLAFLDTTLK